MVTTITGVGSGFDITGWVSSLVAAKQESMLAPLQTKLNTLQEKNSALSGLKSKYSALQSALQTFTKTVYNSSSDMWNNTTITSSNDAYATASSTGKVAASQIDLEIKQVATATVAKSTKSIGTVSKEDIENAKFTSLANGQAKAGDFSMFVNGKEFKVTIDESDTVADVIKKIEMSSAGKVRAEVDTDGIFMMRTYKPATQADIDNNDSSLVIDDDGNKWVRDHSTKFTLGSGADTSNFVSALKLNKPIGTTGFKSSYSISTVNTDKAMAGAESGLSGIRFWNPEDDTEAESGKITINGVDFTVDKTTSLNNLISRINGNSEANVKASYDALTNKLILTSTQTGESSISLKETGTNLLNVLNLTTGEKDNEIISTGSQVLGQNAIIKINGNEVISASNTITGESTGIANLSITVKKPTSAYSGNEDDEKDVSLTIDPDYTAVKDALKKFVNAYNEVVTATKSASSSTGALSHNAGLNSLMNSIRSVTSMVSDNEGMYSMLSQIGISTTNTDTTKLSINDKKLDEALSKNFDSVRALLSDGFTSKEDNGIFDKLTETLTSFLDVEKGFFAQQTESFDSQIKSMNSRIERTNKTISRYEARLTNQFNKMDSTVAALNAQLATFGSYFSR